MTYVKKSGNSYSVHKGNDGKRLYTFRGKNARARAQAKMQELHKKHKPKQVNRGTSARRKNRK